MPKNTRNTRNTDTDTDTDSDNDNTYIKESGKPLSREKKGFIRPTLEEFQGYCSNELMDYNLDSENIFRAYDEADWHDSRGNKILNWKQKIRQVWCNDSSRKKEDAEISALKAMIVLPREDEDERLTKMGFNL